MSDYAMTVSEVARMLSVSRSMVVDALIKGQK